MAPAPNLQAPLLLKPQAIMFWEKRVRKEGKEEEAERRRGKM